MTPLPWQPGIRWFPQPVLIQRLWFETNAHSEHPLTESSFTLLCMLQSPTGGSILSSKCGKTESKKLNPDIKGHLSSFYTGQERKVHPLLGCHPDLLSTCATAVQQWQVRHYFYPGGLQCHELVICPQLLDWDQLNRPGSTAAAEKPSCARAISRTVFSVWCPPEGNSCYLLIFHHMSGLRWSVHEHHLVLSSMDGWHTDDGSAEHVS